MMVERPEGGRMGVPVVDLVATSVEPGDLVRETMTPVMEEIKDHLEIECLDNKRQWFYRCDGRWSDHGAGHAVGQDLGTGRDAQVQIIRPIVRSRFDVVVHGRFRPRPMGNEMHQEQIPGNKKKIDGDGVEGHVVLAPSETCQDGIDNDEILQ